MNNIIKDGKYLLSGIGNTTLKRGFYEESVDVNLFCLDGITYGAYINPDDGFRSYGDFMQMKDGVKCQYQFPPQEVIVTNKVITGDPTEDDWYGEDKRLIVITDAINGKEILVVGTDFYDSYYPMAIFNYTPENLEINKNK